MKFLSDTQIFLWSFLEPKRVRGDVRQLLEDSEVYLSAASAFEIAIKAGQGKLHLPDSPDKYVPAKMQQSCRSRTNTLCKHTFYRFITKTRSTGF